MEVPHRKPTVKKKNTVTEEATAIFPSQLSGSSDPLPLNGNQTKVKVIIFTQCMCS